MTGKTEPNGLRIEAAATSATELSGALAIPDSLEAGIPLLSRFLRERNVSSSTFLRAATEIAPRPVDSSTTLQSFATRVGFPVARATAVAFALRDEVTGPGWKDDPVHGRELWRHSVATGIASGILASSVGDVVPEQAILTGILHDVGILLLGLGKPALLRRVRDRVRKGAPILEVEEELFGRSHAAVGAGAIVAWGLPEAIALAVAHHHDPLRAPREVRRLACVVHAADVMMVPDDANLGVDPCPASHRAIESLRIETADLLRFHHSSRRRLERLAAAVSPRNGSDT